MLFPIKIKCKEKRKSSKRKERERKDGRFSCLDAYGKMIKANESGPRTEKKPAFPLLYL